MNLFIKKIKIYVMDKSFETLKEYENIMNKLYPNEKIEYFTNYSDLEKLIKEDNPHFVILDGDSPYGIITAKKIKEINHKIKVIIASSKEGNVLDVYQNNLNGFIKKPFTFEVVKESLN